MPSRIRRSKLFLYCFSSLILWIIFIYVVFVRRYNSKETQSKSLRSDPVTDAISQEQIVAPIVPRHKSEFLCLFNPETLPSVVWSHRAHSGDNELDGSRNAVSKLISQGICNFDVDVSILPDKWIPRFNSRFVVAHPTLLKESASLSNFQTVESFLYQVMRCMEPLHFSPGMSRHIDPFVTLEPKFENISDIIFLLETVDKVVMGTTGHAAVIVRDMVTLQAVQEFHISRWRSFQDGTHRFHGREPPIPVAVAYRSTTSHERLYPDIPWPLSSIPLSDSPTVAIPRHLSISTRTLTPGSYSAPLLRQIHMPDVQLLISNNREHTPYQFIRNGDTEADPVIAWVVDTEDMMWRALDAGADAVISNRPIELLNILRTRYHELCLN